LGAPGATWGATRGGSNVDGDCLANILARASSIKYDRQQKMRASLGIMNQTYQKPLLEESCPAP
jgi:hypothetical protein